MNIQNQKFEKFKALHYTSTPLLLPNVWDVLGASLLEEIGYTAIATSSSAIALTHGYHDGEQIPFEEHLKQVARIAKSVAIPVSVDIENGYATTDEELQQNISKLIDAGIVGINYEDSDKHTNQLINIEEQSRRIKLIKNTATQMGASLLVNARIDTYVHGNYTDSDLQLNETLIRAKAYKEAGADCLFPIIIKDYGHISTLVKEAGLPINVMIFAGCPDIKAIKDLGVQRISMGSSFLKIALQQMKSFAENALRYDISDEIHNNSITSNYLENLVKGG